MKNGTQEFRKFKGSGERSGWDSNPRTVARHLISSQGRYDHFDTLPQRLNYINAGLFCQERECYTYVFDIVEKDVRNVC